MRKAGAIILFVATLLFANGCSEEKNTENLSEKMREYVTAAVETTDDFLDGKIGGAEAVERLGNAYKAADRHYEAEEAANEGDTIGTYISNDQFAVFDILLLECEVQDKVDGTGTEEKIIEKRNDLAEKIGEKRGSCAKEKVKLCLINKQSFIETNAKAVFTAVLVTRKIVA